MMMKRERELENKHKSYSFHRLEFFALLKEKKKVNQKFQKSFYSF